MKSTATFLAAALLAASTALDATAQGTSRGPAFSAPISAAANDSEAEEISRNSGTSHRPHSVGK